MKSIARPDIERFQLKLESCCEEALRALVLLDSQARYLDVDSPMDSADRSVSHLVRESLYQLSSQCRNLLRSIEAALERIREGTYGICEMCGDDISPRRLEALPWTDCCLGCQERMEQQCEAERSRDARVA
jgi:DnaK suppressor protein